MVDAVWERLRYNRARPPGRTGDWFRLFSGVVVALRLASALAAVLLLAWGVAAETLDLVPAIPAVFADDPRHDL